MKNQFAVTLCIACLGLVNSRAALIDNFNGSSINPDFWNTYVTSVGNSSLSESSGNVRLVNGAALITASDFANASIAGRFRLSGWEYDRMKVLLRSDGTSVDSHWQTRIGGLGVQFTARENPDYGPSQTLQLWDFQTGTLLGTASPTINMNTYYDFLITDSGSEIQVFLGGFASPVLSVSTSARYGNKIEFTNREQLVPSGPPPYYSDLDFVAITSRVPDSGSTAAMFSMAGLLLLGLARKVKDYPVSGSG